jgi:GNAT superfamily N-acetyltransferase
MPKTQFPATNQQVEIRKLWPADACKLAEHFLRLSARDRNLRFGGAVSEEFIADYAKLAISSHSVVLGCFFDDTLRGAGELRFLVDQYPIHGEIALALESGWQNKGLGSELLRQLITIARNRTVATLHMICLPQNMRIQHIARQNEFQLRDDIDTVEGLLTPNWPDAASLAEELLHDGTSFVRAILRL